jgi:hypothetical protein
MRHWCDVQKIGHDAHYQDLERYETRQGRCPKCDASIGFYRSEKPHIDECGFESYSFKCRVCGSMLVGIIDPADDTLLVTISS